MDNLPLLRDIHLPEEISAFPLGYGWAVIAGVLVLLYAGYCLLQYIRTKSKKYYALKLLQNAAADDLSSARQISEILRRICVYKYKEAASLFGEKWIDFLNTKSRIKITNSAAELLVYAPYMPQSERFKPEDYQQLKTFAKNWIGENL